MTRVLLVNHNIEKCGVFNFGVSMYRCWKGSKEYQISLGCYDNWRNLLERLNDYDVFIFNWHSATLPWVSQELIDYLRNQGKKVFLIPHDEIVAFDRERLDAILYIDPSLDEKTLDKKEYVLGRPILPLTGGETRTKNAIIYPKIGFAGFCFEHKRIEGILDIIGDLPCQIRLHLPPSHWGYNPNYISEVEALFATKISKNQSLKVSKDFLTIDGLIWWMHENDLMIFNYEDTKMINHGISSITDIALAARTPFLISNSNQFRHLKEVFDYCKIGKVKPIDAINRGFGPFLHLVDRWSPENHKKKLAEIIASTS